MCKSIVALELTYLIYCILFGKGEEPNHLEIQEQKNQSKQYSWLRSDCDYKYVVERSDLRIGHVRFTRTHDCTFDPSCLSKQLLHFRVELDPSTTSTNNVVLMITYVAHVFWTCTWFNFSASPCTYSFTRSTYDKNIFNTSWTREMQFWQLCISYVPSLAEDSPYRVI